MNRKLRLALVASALAAVATISGAQATTETLRPAQPGIDLSGIHGFDFLVGEWRVHHRRISAVSKKWVEFHGTLRLRLLMEGAANMEEHEQDGRKIIGRLQWSAMTRTSAHWEQANSYDDGKTWQPNWIMELQRVQ